jgi:mono/diheme cytochrome c family protein
MKRKAYSRLNASICLLLSVLALGSFVFAAGRSTNSPNGPASNNDARKESAKDATPGPVVSVANADSMRLQGEQRFRANCGRCHAAPQKFPPRMMATVLRHMRVRATITDADMRLVLFYMTQ